MHMVDLHVGKRLCLYELDSCLLAPRRSSGHPYVLIVKLYFEFRIVNDSFLYVWYIHVA